MSNDLYWQPVKHDARPLPVELRSILATRFFAGDGSLNEQVTISNKDLTDIAWLEGVYYMSIDPITSEGLEVLLCAIQTHKVVRVWVGRESD